MDILEKGSLGYVQALTLLANYLQKRNKPNAGFILIGISFSMALSIGLHREFDVHNTTPFMMEVRRRVWWTLFVFVSGAQLALGRPATSLVGVNVQLPTNLDDIDLAVDMEELPSAKPDPTIASCLIEQVKLAKVANKVHDELLTHRRPSYATALKLEDDIRAWWDGLPWYLVENYTLEPRLEFSKRVLLWRSFNLRIVLNRPFLFENIAIGAPLDDTCRPIRSCLAAADECIRSISGFVKSVEMTRRGFAWYTTAWLITAGFVQATCLIYSPHHKLAPDWKLSLRQTVDCLQILGSSLDIALRAREVLQNVLGEHSPLESCRAEKCLDVANMAHQRVLCRMTQMGTVYQTPPPQRFQVSGCTLKIQAQVSPTNASTSYRCFGPGTDLPGLLPVIPALIS